ncbi:condensation domain-containing protein [Plantactinospora sp. ZYX-F-223]|uniref:condensation domain-containing protein n=1 Tax=Plantactinospora sp. ZYX-F-223 TaxID=3144103 RepID=UPI0031FD71B5
MPSRQARLEPVSLDTDAVHPLLPGQLAHHRALLERPDGSTSLFMSYRVSGPLDVAALLAAVRSTVARHAALRIGVTTLDGVPVQWIRPMPDNRQLVALTQVTAKDAAQFARYVRAVLAADLKHTFDLAVEYPFIFRLLRFSPTLHAVIGVFSGFAVDATARMIVVRGLWDTYFGRATDTDPEDAGYVAAVTGQATAATDRSHAVSTYWRRRGPWLPPRCQFLPSLGEPAAPVAQTELLLVVGDEWQDVRGRWQESGFTTVQWLLAVFATTVFLATPQDRIAVSMSLNGRRHVEREVVGMFDVTVPVVLDRPARPVDLLVQTRRELLTATSRRNVAPQALDDMWATVAQRLGHPVHRTLVMTYLADNADHDSPDGSAITVERGAYTPEFHRTADGLRIAANERPDGLRIRLTVDGATMSEASFAGFVAAFRAQLRGEDSCRITPTTGSGSQLTPLRAPDGTVLLVVDLAEVTSTLDTHPAVVSSRAFVEIAEDGGSLLAAEVTVAGVEVTPDDLANHIRSTVASRPFLAVPGRIAVVPSTACGERSEALSRDGVG